MNFYKKFLKTLVIFDKILRKNTQKIINRFFQLFADRFLVLTLKFYTQYIAKHLVCSPIYFYKIFVDPFKSKCCKFNISCSNFAIKIITKKGPIKGIYYSIRRILRCR